MSKAFVRESDEAEGRPEEPQALPVGFKNYMTPQGHRQLHEELRTLHRVERPKVVDVVSWAAGNGDRSERLHLRQAPSTRDRSENTLSFQTAGDRASGRPDAAVTHGSGVL